MPATEQAPRLRVSGTEIARMQAAASTLKNIRSLTTGNNRGILDTLTAGSQPFRDWQHYPLGEIYDRRTHAQYFYHIHGEPRAAPHEHGHFHTFLRAEGMPMGVAPLVLPETALAHPPTAGPQAAPAKYGSRDEVSHLVAISLNAAGEPIRLFTTNRWVTGETWYRADDVIRMLDRFTFVSSGEEALLNEWLSAIVALFRPQIAWLLRKRDDVVTGWRRRRRTNVFEDTRLEVTSSSDIDLELQFAFLDQLPAEPDPGSPTPTMRLPRMAEGWGDGFAH